MGVASRGRPKCTDCGRRQASWRVCESCKEFNRVLTALHVGCDRDQPGKQLRVELYAAVVEAGGRIFERR